MPIGRQKPGFLGLMRQIASERYSRTELNVAWPTALAKDSAKTHVVIDVGCRIADANPVE